MYINNNKSVINNSKYSDKFLEKAKVLSIVKVMSSLLLPSIMTLTKNQLCQLNPFTKVPGFYIQ